MKKVVIIDTGVNLNHSKLKEDYIEGISLTKKSSEIVVGHNIMDNYGHGTAIYGIIRKYVSPSDIYIIKISNSDEANEDVLLFALQYVYQKVDCKFINLSLGIDYDNNELQDICCRLYRKGIIMISAFSNNENISFPAAYPFVLGVDSSIYCKKANDFEYVDDKIVNVRAKGAIQRLLWKKPEFVFMRGNSFACAYITGLLAEVFKDKDAKINLKEVHSFLKKNIILRKREE